MEARSEGKQGFFAESVPVSIYHESLELAKLLQDRGDFLFNFHLRNEPPVEGAMGPVAYRGTSLIRNRRLLGPYSGPVQKGLEVVLGWGAVSYGRGTHVQLAGTMAPTVLTLG